jgi:predicted nucleic acid-binding protein
VPSTFPLPTGGVFFLDTNIFVYALLANEPLKKQRALQLVEQALGSRLGCTSYQVIQEFANVGIKKFAQRFSTDDCKQFIDAAMQPLNRVTSSPELMNDALDLQNETRYSFYDCLVIASALQAGADVLYSEDLQHNHFLGGSLRILNPFLHTANQPV